MTDAEATTEEVNPQPLEGDELVDAVASRRDSINPQFSSYDQGRHEELTWVYNLIAPQTKEVAAEEEVVDESVDDPFDTSS